MKYENNNSFAVAEDTAVYLPTVPKRAKNPRFPADLPQPERVDMDHDIHMIRNLLALPPNKRTNFLRVRLPNGGSAI